MKRSLVIVLVSVLLASCTNQFNEIKVTSYELVSVSPKGLSSIDVTINLGISNPAPQLTLSRIEAVVKKDSAPFLHLSADDVTLEGKSEFVCPLTVHGSLDSSFNPLSLLSLVKDMDLSPFTIDLSAHASLKNGLGKDIEYKDLSLAELMKK